MSLLDSLKSFLKGSDDIIKKSDIEKTMELAFKGLKEDVIPSYQELLKMNPEVYNKSVTLILSKSLKGKTGTEILQNILKQTEYILKNENDIRKVVKSLPENIPTNYITSKKASIISLVSVLASYSLTTIDTGILFVTKPNEKDFSKATYENMNASMNALPNLSIFINDLQGFFKSLEKADDELNINEDNASLESVLRGKGGLPVIPNLGFAFIGKAIYTVRIWLVENELEKFEILKSKKHYLMKKLMEIENQINNAPDDVKLKRAKEVYVAEIEKLTYKINKIANS